MESSGMASAQETRGARKFAHRLADTGDACVGAHVRIKRKAQRIFGQRFAHRDNRRVYRLGGQALSADAAAPDNAAPWQCRGLQRRRKASRSEERNGIQMVNMFSAFDFILRQTTGTPCKASAYSARPIAGAWSFQASRCLQLNAQNGRLDFIEPGVIADFFMLIFDSRAMIAQGAHPVGDLV